MNNSYLIVYNNQKDLRALRKLALYSSIYNNCVFTSKLKDYDPKEFLAIITMTHDLLTLVKLKCFYKKLEQISIIVLADGENLSILQALEEENFIILSRECKVNEFRENLKLINPKDNNIIKITKREKQVLSLILKGQNNSNIARQLGISERTIEAHRRNIYLKIGVHSFSQLTIWAIDNKLLKAN
jgi:DNA-binding CsgD family transcriptional regulator